MTSADYDEIINLLEQYLKLRAKRDSVERSERITSAGR